MHFLRLFAVAVSACSLVVRLSGQTQTFYPGSEVTGQLTLVRTVNALAQAQSDARQSSTQVFSASRLQAPASGSREVPKFPKLPHPPFSKQLSRSSTLSTATMPAPGTAVLGVITSPATASFNGLTHSDQRLANGGRQFSVEPPSPGVAVSGNFILEGVNNAIQVYDVSGKALLPATLATNELFGVAPAIDRTTGVNGVYPTDLRVFYDPDINRWFVLQRSQDNDIFGTPLNSSHLYMAVSQTGDPTGVYNVYVADTTDLANPACPCLEDYLQIGADQYGFYISADEYNTGSLTFVNATIWAISKAALQSGSSAPTAFRFNLPNNTGYEFAVLPATTPPHASYFLAAGGLEYFASTNFTFSVGSSVAIWAMSNTSSLATSHPGPTLAQIVVPTLTYAFPDAAVQPDGPRPYGASISSLAPVPFLDGGDTRALSLSYAGGGLYLTLSTAAQDGNQQPVVGGALIVFSPAFRNNLLSASVLRQNYLVVNGASLLRPAIAVTALGQGAIAATLVAANLYPSAAFVPISGPFVTPTTVQVAGTGTLPEDGFTGYSGSTAPAAARWGDYSAAVVAGDGSVWMAVEYIANLPRTPLANWDTFVDSWSFTTEPPPLTAPDQPTLSSPGNSAGLVSINLLLQWNAANRAATYDVYFGTSSSPSLYQSGVNGTSLTVNGLSYSTTYYWYVIARNNAGSSPASDTWSFTTAPITGVSQALQFIAIAPCRVADTRWVSGPFGGPSVAAQTTRQFTISSSSCSIPTTAAAFSLNVTVVPSGSLGYLTVWPAGGTRPTVSTLNSLDGRIKANATIIPAGTGGAVSVYASNTTDLVLDINGYFVPAGSNAAALAFYPLPPCRIADTRNPMGDLGGPPLSGGQTRVFPILNSACSIPATAEAYSLNFTAVPKGPLGYISVSSGGESQPLVSTLNAPTGAVTANAAIVAAGSSGNIDVYASNNTDLVIDVNGYFAPPGSGGLSLYAVTPCRVLDTRQSSGQFSGTVPVNFTGSACAPPATAQAFVLNATVVPPAALGYLTLWPDGQTQPPVSTLNALDGSITSNMAIVPASKGSIDAFASNATQLVLDISSYFAP